MLNAMWYFKNIFEKISKNVLETTRQTKYQYTYFGFISRLLLKEMPLHKVYTLKSKHKETETFSYKMIIISHFIFHVIEYINIYIIYSGNFEYLLCILTV